MSDYDVTKSVNSSFHGDPSLQAWLDDELARVTATNLHDEFATVVDTATAVSELAY